MQVPSLYRSNKPTATKRDFGLAFGFLAAGLAVMCVTLRTQADADPQKEDPKITQAKQDIEAVNIALETFAVDMGRYPTMAEGLGGLSTAPAGAKDWRGPYVGRPVGNDPWGHRYMYVIPGKHNKNGFDAYSSGPDGKAGTKDDLGNWKDKKVEK